MHVEPFRINVSDRTLDDLRDRLTGARFPHQVRDASWDYGTNLAYVKELVEYCWTNITGVARKTC